MKPYEIEAWALRLVEEVRLQHPIEDMLAEAKGEWIPPIRAARRLAAHANSAHGGDILWVIGLDEKRGVRGVEQAEFSTWWSAVQACFDELAPTCTHHLNVPAHGKTVVALLFETDRAPFVVKNPVAGQSGGGPVSLEVPWREGVATRSARRSHLIRLLAPQQRMPDVEIMSGKLESSTDRLSDGHTLNTCLNLSLKLYIVPNGPLPLVVPFHRCRGSLILEGWQDEIGQDEVPLDEFHLGPNYSASIPLPGGPPQRNLSHTVRSSDSEVLIDGPGLVNLHATSIWFDSTDKEFPKRIEMRCQIRPVALEVPTNLKATFRELAALGDKNPSWYIPGLM